MITDHLSPVSWFVGTCGFWDSDWNDNFYPKGLVKDRLPFYARHFNAIELNTTFHAIPKPEKVQRWKDETPPEFRFSVKFPKEVTHGRPERLLAADTLEITSRFFDAIQELGEKLEVVLMQFPPWFSALRRLALLRFIDRLRCPARLVFEFRDDSWWTPTTALALRERNIGWVVADLAGHPAITCVPVEWQLRSFGLRQLIFTADFVYARLIGKHHQFPVHVAEYFDSTPRVKWWHERLTRVLKACPSVRRVYVFFDNDFSGNAPTSARRFANMVKLPPIF
jgi:uncharacterized protein YecE (DUF72 family)